MTNSSIREGYDDLGVEKYYKKHQCDYCNPHEKIIKKLLKAAHDDRRFKNNILDLCCGSGEVTRTLLECDPSYDITGLDPYTAQAYYTRTGKNAIELSFRDIADGKLYGHYDHIICSFALHLCPESMLPIVLWQLGEVSDSLIILTPHKRPDCDQVSGWYLVEEKKEERVRMRFYLGSR